MPFPLSCLQGLLISVRIHKENSSPFCTGAVAVLLFLTVCAYFGAELFERLSPSAQTLQAEKRIVTECAQFYGIALRQEQLVCSPEGRDFSPENFKKYSADECRAVWDVDCESAVFLSNCDGYEYLSPNFVYPFNADCFSRLIISEPRSLRNCAGRLVFDDSWYFAAQITSGNMPQKGSLCTVSFEGIAESCKATVWAVAGDCVLLRLNSCSEELLSLRKCSAQIIFSQLEGIEVPRNALHRDEDGKFYVSVLSSGLVEKRSVDIIYAEENFVLSRCFYGEDALRVGEMMVLVVSDEYC